MACTERLLDELTEKANAVADFGKVISSQALFDERALLPCFAFVDLNTIRAGMAPTPERSEHTSIKKRIYNNVNRHRLESFVGIKRNSIGISYRLKDYIELVDWTGRNIRDDKRGHIPNSLPNILDRLSFDVHVRKELTTQFEEHFQPWVKL